MEEDDDGMCITPWKKRNFFLLSIKPSYAGVFSSIMDIYKYKSADSKPLSVFIP
jgi:hypothetical protein